MQSVKMNKLRRTLFPYAFALVMCLTAKAVADDHSNVLWYDRPAARWEEALPVGNGRLGAMVFGHPTNERLQINEDTLWAGGPYDPVNPQAKDALPEAGQLVFDG